MDKTKEKYVNDLLHRHPVTLCRVDPDDDVCKQQSKRSWLTFAAGTILGAATFATPWATLFHIQNTSYAPNNNRYHRI